MPPKMPPKMPNDMITGLIVGLRRAALSGLVLIAIAQPAMSQDIPPTAVTIDDDPFSLNLVARIIQQLPQEVLNRPPQTYYDQVLDDIIDTHLAADAARATGLADNPAIDEIATRAYEAVLAQAFIQQAVNERLTDEMLDSAYNDFVADSESRTEVRARHILVATEEEAVAVIGRLDNGEDFAAIAEEVSIGPSSENGGELGYFRRGAMVPAFELAAFAMSGGSYSESPIQTQFGWHVIRVEDRRIAPPPPLENIRDQLVSNLSSRLVGDIFSELRGEATITRLSFDEARAAGEAAQQNP